MNNNTLQTPRALPTGTVLSHKYIIEEVIGEGGFGITYTCTSRSTSGELYAVKEYFPDNSAYRILDDNSHTILPYVGKQDIFKKGRSHFLKEAGILSRFSYLEHIVSIHDIIEENGTVYIVMEYIDGITLKQYVEENEPLTIDELSPLITPVMGDLSEIHKNGLLHRDISPDNLILGTDNNLYLIDFGSADFETVGETELKTVILKPGFAPPEQYITDGRLGAWTDIYGICATIYYALTGFAPADSIMRQQKDELPALSAYSQIRSWQADVIMKGLNLHPADRYQSIEDLYKALIIPPVEISLDKKEKLNAIKYDKTVMPSNNNIRTDKSIDNNKLETKGVSNINNNTKIKSRHLILKIAIACSVIMLLYACVGFAGASLPLWSDNWTYASLNNSSDNDDKDTPVDDRSSQATLSEETLPNKSDTSNTGADNSTNDKNDQNNNILRSTVTTTTENKKTANTSKATGTSGSDTDHTQSKGNSTTAENTEGKTSGTQNNQKPTEKSTSTQSKDTFITMPDDEYDTFTD